MPRKQESSQGDCFDKLPEDVVLLILNRVKDLKTIYQFLIVSKRFASVIYDVETIIVRLPRANPHPNGEKISVICLLHFLMCNSREDIPNIMQQSFIEIFKFYQRLEKFRKLKFIYLEFSSPTLSSGYSPMRLKLICRSHGSMVESVVAVLPASISKKRKHQPVNVHNGFECDEEPINRGNPVEFFNKKYGDSRYSLLQFSEWLVIVFSLIKTQDSLESLIISDGNDRARDDVFVMQGKELVEWRNLLLFREFPKKVTPKYFHLIRDREMHLPVSGYVMEDVLCMILCLQDESHDLPAVECDDVMTWQYNGEKELLGEAVTVLKKKVGRGTPWDTLYKLFSQYYM